MSIHDPNDWTLLFIEEFRIPNYDPKTQTVRGYKFYDYQVLYPILKIGVNVENQKPTWNLGCYAYQAIKGGMTLTGYKFGDKAVLRRRFCRAGIATICDFEDVGLGYYTLMIQLPLWLMSVRLEVFGYIGDVPIYASRKDLPTASGLATSGQPLINDTNFGQIIPGAI